MNDRKLISCARRELAKLPVTLLGIVKHHGHLKFRLRLPDGSERSVGMSGSPTDPVGAPQAMAREVRRMISGYYA